jgi:Alginate export
MLKKCKHQLLLACIAGALYPAVTTAQLSLTGQYRARAEWRDGVGNLTQKGSHAAAFISQRARINIGYKTNRVAFGLALQDVRVWGQDASTISNADGNRLMVHEAWAELTIANHADSSIRFRLLEQLSLKLGRQELNYDDARLIGNLDWLQQGRRHDMALLKLSHKGLQGEIGFAFNQNTDAFGYNGTGYVPANIPAYVRNSFGTLVQTPTGMVPLSALGNAGNASTKGGTPIMVNPPSTNGMNQNYKSFTSVYLSKQIHRVRLSGLFFNDHFSRYRLDSVGSSADGFVYGRRFAPASLNDDFNYNKTNSRYTYGLMANATLGKSPSVALQGAYYRQSGHNRDGMALRDAFHYTLSAAIAWGKTTITPGYDVLSGNKTGSVSDGRFDPLYGTPHRHWGFMDFFYAGTGSPVGGLENGYLKIKYTTPLVTIGADVHGFWLNHAIALPNAQQSGQRLGTEVDIVMTVPLNKMTIIEIGYAHMAATDNMVYAKGQANSAAAATSFHKNADWVYTSIKFAPDFLAPKSAKH